MTTIKQLLEMPIGEKTGGFELTIKKFPTKMVEVGKKKLQQVVFIDDTGEIPAEIHMAKRVTLQKGWAVHITICEIQGTGEGKKLYVDQWWLPTMSCAEYEAKQHDIQQEIRYGEPVEVTRGKVRHGLCCALIQASGLREGIPTCSEGFKKDVNAWVDFIMTGE